MGKVTRLFVNDPHVSLSRYAEQLAKLKGVAQWKARALAVLVPNEAVLASKGPIDAVRLLALRFLYDSQAGDAIAADLRSRSHFIDETSETWLSE